jgi:hypothetical protein
MPFIPTASCGVLRLKIMAFLFQTFDIKILNANDIETIDIHPRELMQEIISLAIDSLMQLGNLIFEGFIIIRSTHRSGQLCLQPGKLIFGLFCTSWILYLIANGVNHKRSQTEIQTYCFSSFR